MSENSKIKFKPFTCIPYSPQLHTRKIQLLELLWIPNSHAFFMFIITQYSEPLLIYSIQTASYTLRF